VRQARSTLGETSERPKDAAAMRASGYLWAAVDPPLGYTLDESQVEIKRDTSGRARVVAGGMRFSAPGTRFPVSVEVYGIEPGETVEITEWDPSSGSSTWVYTTRAGLPALVSVGSPGPQFEKIGYAHIVAGDLYARVHAPGLDSKAILELLDALAEAAK
jgi:hypothetical protein